MIQQQTILKVADNSGAKTVKCIKVLGGFKRKVAFLGDLIIVSIQHLRNKSRNMSKVTKGEVHKALIVRTKKKINKNDGSFYLFSENAVSLINKQNKPIASRLTGPLPKKLRLNKFLKLASISSSGFF
jgi:large subunit ribosomal protein L14